MASTLFFSKNYLFFFFHLRLLPLKSLKAFLRRRDKPWVLSYLDPGVRWPRREPLCFNQVMCSSCQHDCVLWGKYLLSLWPCSLRAYLSLGKSEFNSYYLGLLACLVKPMRFIQVENPDGKWPGAMVVRPLASCFAWPVSTDSPGASCPLSAGPFSVAVL